MTNTATTGKAPHALCIDGEMTIYRAAELKQMLLAALDEAVAVEVDLSKVTEIDSAGVQLLMFAKRTAAAGGRTLRLVAHSPAVLDVMELLDLGSHFSDPMVLSPRAA